MAYESLRQFERDLEKLRDIQPIHTELQARPFVLNLLMGYARPQDLTLMHDTRVDGTAGKRVQPDGVLKNRLPLSNSIRKRR